MKARLMSPGALVGWAGDSPYRRTGIGSRCEGEKNKVIPSGEHVPRFNWLQTWYWGAILKHGVRIVTRTLGHIRSPISDLGAAGKIWHFAFLSPPAEGP